MHQTSSISRLRNIDVYRLLPEGTRIELIDYRFYMPVKTPAMEPVQNIDVFRLFPDGTRIELIDNCFYMPPSLNSDHKISSGDIFVAIKNYLKKNPIGVVLSAPLDVYFDEKSNSVQPDIIFISKENLSIIHKKGAIHGVPDLLIEILSEGNENYDKIYKYSLYEKFGVKEYWIVEPVTKKTIGYKLVSGKYELIGELERKIGFVLLKTIVEF
ncbi:MAG: Uma2 family endonuclease [Parafilimonas sp.]